MSLTFIAIYPFASYLIGSQWLRDTHWSRTFANLGQEVFNLKREDTAAPLEKWEKTVLSWMRSEAQSPVLRTDEGVVRAVPWLIGRRRTPVAEARVLRLQDGLLARAIKQQIGELQEVPYGRGLAKEWRKALARREGFISILSLRTFAWAWARHTVIQLGFISAAALFLGALVGLSWWVGSALAATDSEPRASADWTVLTGAIVTFASVVAVSVALAWQLTRALLAMYPRPTTWFGRLAVAFVAFALLSPAFQFTIGFTRFDVNAWMQEDSTRTRIVGGVLLAVCLTTAVFFCVRFVVRRATRAGERRRFSARLLALSCAVYLFPLIPVMVTVGLDVEVSIGLLSLVFSGIQVATVLVAAAGVIFLRECFAQWRELQAAGARISRLGFRQWQAWVWLVLAFAPITASALLAQLSPEALEDQDSPLAATLLLSSVLAIPWFLLFGVLGGIFIVRVGNAWDTRRAAEAMDTMPRTFVTPERLLHHVLVNYPFGAATYGREMFVLKDPEDESIWITGVPDVIRVEGRQAPDSEAHSDPANVPGQAMPADAAYQGTRANRQVIVAIAGVVVVFASSFLGARHFRPKPRH